MRKRIVIVALVLLGALVALILFRPLFNSEPQYRGKRLSVWFKQYYRSGEYSRHQDEPRHERAAQALRAMGTSAIPFLVTVCFTTNQESSFQTNLMMILAKLPEPFRFPPFVPAMMVREEAAVAIGEINPSAKLLLPLVTNRLNDPDKFRRWMAVYLLGRIGEGGEAAVPFLREKLLSSDAQELSLAALSLDRLGPAAGSAVPELTEFVRTNQLFDVYYACRTLARIGPAASNAIPVLQARLGVETNASKQGSIAVALICIDGRQTGALAVLPAGLANQLTNAPRHALYALRDIGTNARPALPLLAAALNDPDSRLWQLALFAILSLGETNLAISSALEKLEQGDQAARYNAMTFLLRVQPTNAAAMSNLVLEVNGVAWGSSAIDEAARLGALAQPVIPRLREIAASKTNPHRDAARKALAAIEADLAAERDVR